MIQIYRVLNKVALWPAVVLVMLLAQPPVYADANENYDVKAHYDKAEYSIPMRDGKKMFTAVYRPKDRSKDYPILLFRTPYSIKAYGDDFPPVMRMAPSVDFLKSGYIIVLQDLRGTYKSEGDFKVIRSIRDNKDDPVAIDASTDNYDTIEWLLHNIEGNNGKVGQWGISYPGWTTVMGMVDAHPALVASSPQASPSDMFVGDDWHHNGAFRLMYSFSWMNFAARKRDDLTTELAKPFDYGTPWGYEFFLNAGPTSELNEKYFGGAIPAWNDFIDHPNYDKFWKDQVALPHMKNINHSILNVAGWFDAEDFYGPISIYNEIEKTTPGNKSTLVVGPWRHGGWLTMDGSYLGDIQFGSKTSEYYQKNIVFPFFEYNLKGKGDWNPAEAIVFETGNNEWHRFDQWPPKASKVKNLYFQEGGKLSFNKPADKSKKAFDKYVNDPAKPVPFSTEIITAPGHDWMIEDQRQVSTRPDVLTYRTDVLEEDITIAGPILASLFVSTTGTDADYFVKLIDVYPGDAPDVEIEHQKVKMGDYQMLVGVEVMRAKYRESMSDPKPLKPGKVTPISFNIWDKFHTFKKGHRIMVQVHSSWFPAYDRNPQQFMDIYRATEKDFKTAEHDIYRSVQFPSHLELPVLTGNQDVTASAAQ
ncbi:CocE/NonD family hydrolase [Kordiimonas pumila]|nr:CocE/NonD family hydrolase [Kordiimonas pumila]